MDEAEELEQILRSGFLDDRSFKTTVQKIIDVGYTRSKPTPSGEGVVISEQAVYDEIYGMDSFDTESTLGGKDAWKIAKIISAKFSSPKVDGVVSQDEIKKIIKEPLASALHYCGDGMRWANSKEQEIIRNYISKALVVAKFSSPKVELDSKAMARMFCDLENENPDWSTHQIMEELCANFSQPKADKELLDKMALALRNLYEACQEVDADAEPAERIDGSLLDRALEALQAYETTQRTGGVK